MFKTTNQYGTFYFKDEEMTILHREDGPAWRLVAGDEVWYFDGERHREDGPAVIRRHGPVVEIEGVISQYWYKDCIYPDIKNDKQWTSFLKMQNFL